MDNLKISIVGFGWYAEADYLRILEVMEDADLLHRSWAAWHAAAQKGIEGFEARGIRAVKVQIKPDEFVAWCRARGLDVNAKARNAFGNEGAIRALREEGAA